MKAFNVSAWALNHQALIRYFLVVLLCSGIFSYLSLGRMEDPEFTIKVMVVQVYWPGATAREMEQQVTDVLEKKLQEVPDLDFVRSYSKPGEAALFINLKESARAPAVREAWYQVRKKVGDIRHTLPDGVLGPYFNDEFGDTFGSIYAITGKDFSYAQLKAAADRVRQELLRVDNVAKVDIVGAQAEQITVELSESRLATLGISPLLIMQVLQAQNAIEPSGQFDGPHERIWLRADGDVDSLNAIANLGISANGRIFRLGDIAHVQRAYRDPPEFRMYFQGQPALGLALSMRQGGNITQLGQALAATLQRVENELPLGLVIQQVSDQPQVVAHSINEFMRVLSEAVLIVLAVSFFSLGLRTGLVVALCIPLVLAMTFLGMQLLHIDLQRISLGALIIALGLLVDDAIIAVEMMALKLEQGWDRLRAATFAYTSTAFPMLTGTLITSIGFLPIGTARSNAGEYTFSIFAVVSLALLISWVVAVLFTPYIGYWLLPKQAQVHDEAAVYQTRFYRGFRRLVSACLYYRKSVMLFTLIIFIAAVYGFRFVPQQFFPASSRPELLVDLWLAEGASFSATETQAQQLEAQLRKNPNVLNVATYVGGGSPRFYLPMDLQLNNRNFAQLVVMTNGGAGREQVLEWLKQQFHQRYPLLRGRAQRLENGPPVGYPVQFRVVGSDPQRLRELAQQLAVLMRQNPYTQDVHDDWGQMVKSLRLEIDHDQARLLGLSAQTIARSVRTFLSGLPISQYREQDKLIDIVLRAPVSERESVQRLLDLNLPISDGRFVPLAQLVRVHPEFEPGVIWRRDRFPTITVRADIVDGVQAPEVTLQIEHTLAPLRAQLPDGYRIEVGGALESSAKSQQSIFAGMPLMLGLVVTLLMFQLQSVSRTVLVLLTAPLGVIGVSGFLLLLQMPFGFVAMLGVISLGGMIMRNTVILVDQIEQDRAAGYSAWEAVVESTVRRFRPIMLTALAAVLGMIPLTYSVFWAPMAVAVMGGLLVATVLTLLFLPALYAAWFRIPRP